MNENIEETNLVEIKKREDAPMLKIPASDLAEGASHFQFSPYREDRLTKELCVIWESFLYTIVSIFVKLHSKWDCCWLELLSDEDLEVVRNAGIVLLQREIPDLVNIQVAKIQLIIEIKVRVTGAASLGATSTSLEGMLLGRFLVGSGMGLGPFVASLYVTEVSPSFVRGTYGSFIQIATCLGLMGALFIGIPVKEIVGWWRVYFWVSVVPAAMLAIVYDLDRYSFALSIMTLPTMQGRYAEAEAALERILGGSHGKPAIAKLAKSGRGYGADPVKFSELLYGRHFGVAFIGSTLYALQQLSGINTVFYFSSTGAGVPSDLANTCIGVANLSGSIIAMILMDRLGRKVLLGSFFGMAVAMGLQVLTASSIVQGLGALYLFFGGMLLFVLTFALGAGPVPGLLLPEILPGRIRARAMSVCLSVHWVGARHKVAALTWFMFTVKSRAPVQRKAVTKPPSAKAIRPRKSPMKNNNSTRYQKLKSFVSKMDSRWPKGRLEYAAEVNVETLKEQCGGMSTGS
ncbi:hypothetical protein GIB67_024925 [Kingdonia uniflora]|uniref:Major facilitator superfamily (MFS) profile domain-containing protein n=1 Tax=Kingdonia uniflora TaxID=39325 RepID=A0A7J7NZ05_9MAGN|nr:hypothetical protein GIB67_024925 [Kingdonia uniflora]